MLILAKANIITDGLRELCAFLCSAIYRILAMAYNLFFKIASFKVLTSNGIKEIYQRVTLILAIVMVFYVTFEFVKYVVEPDAMTDKEKGAHKIVFKMVGVVVLIAFVPTIFSLAYDFEHAIITNGTLSKVILGKKMEDPLYSGRQFSVQVLDIFYNYDGSESEKCDDVNCAGIVKLNKANLVQTGKLPYMRLGLNDKTDGTNEAGAGKVKGYKIHFDALLAVVVGGFIAYMLILYCIDVAVRAIQLVYLQVIAPIPIIGYLSPKKDNMFSKWVKQCVTTYLDIFIRLSLIYFILLICQSLLNSTISTDLAEADIFVRIALIMGLLLFAKKAPKMLQELFPKMGAASGNFGLKAGERVAPAAARAIGAGLGATRLIGGAIARGANTYRRNKLEREKTGMTRKEQKENRKQNKLAMRTAQSNYKQALRNRDDAKKDFAKEMSDINNRTYASKEARDKAIKDATDRYNQKKSQLIKAKDDLVQKKSAYADGENSRYRSVAANALAGGLGGAYRGIRAGAGATKLEDVGKKVKEGYTADKKAINAREEWLNAGGYSGVQRTISGLEQRVGITTPAGVTQRDINQIDANIKSNERLIATESDVKNKEDSSKDRSGSKIEAGEQKTEVKAGQKFTYKDLTGKPQEVTISADGTTSSVYAEYKNRAESARTKADTAAKAYKDLQAAKLNAQIQAPGGKLEPEVEAAYDKAIKEAENNARDAEQKSMEASDAQGKIKKAMQEYAITDMLRHPEASYQDGVLREKVEDTLTSIAETTRDEKTREAMKEKFGDSYLEARDESGNIMKDGAGNVIYEHDERGKPITKYDAYITGHITSYDQMDDIQTALINIANERSRENVELKGSKSRLEASSQTDANKADDKATSGGK